MPSGKGTLDSASGEWIDLITTTYGIASNGDDVTYGSNRGRKWPLNFLPTGSYSVYGNGGDISKRTESGQWWGATGGSPFSSFWKVRSYYLRMGAFSQGVGQGSNERGSGYAIRCVVRS